MKLYEKYESIRDKFEVIAFHDASAKTFEVLDEKLAPTIEKRWEGKALPFPVFLDATGKTVRTYGIRSWPTHVLIDPQGRVVKGNAEKNFEQKLAELAPPEPETKPEEAEPAPEKKGAKDGKDDKKDKDDEKPDGR